MLQWDVILYIEDDDAYSQIVQFALKQSGFKHRLIRLDAAAKAKEYLAGSGEYADRVRYPLPGLILADIKMPGMDGLDLLQWIRTDYAHPYIPFVVLTSSDDLKDVSRAYRLGVNAFVMKPPAVPDLVEFFQSLDTFWVKYNVTTD
ncbi:MAG: response regulator [Limisphaerales bacterium]